MRFVHIADVHLDTSFAGRTPAVRQRLRDASREALRRAVDLAIREDVQALLIAGDLFDDGRLSFATERFLLEQAERLREHHVTVVYATGNHDPGSPAHGPRRLDWPANVHVADTDTPKRIRIHGPDGQPVGYVTAIGHLTDEEKRDLSRLLPGPEQGELPEVALLHTQVHSTRGSENHRPYAPSELAYLIRSGYDYWALGHVHTRQELSTDPPVVYAGSLMGRTHGDSGPRGAILADVSERHGAHLSFRETAPVRWETIEVDHLEKATTSTRLEQMVERAWEASRDQDMSGSGPEWMVRVRLRGACPLWRDLSEEENRRELEHVLTRALGVLDVTVLADEVHPLVPLEEHRTRMDVLGAALRLAEGVRSGEERLKVEAGELVGAPSDDPGAIAAYVADLLSEIDGEIAARLLASRPDGR